MVKHVVAEDIVEGSANMLEAAYTEPQVGLVGEALPGISDGPRIAVDSDQLKVDLARLLMRASWARTSSPPQPTSSTLAGVPIARACSTIVRRSRLFMRERPRLMMAKCR